MLLRNEFTVSADVATVWSHLLDMESVATCVPGAKIEEIVPPNVYKGMIRVRVGPMTVDYRGQATLTELDEDNHVATIHLRAREARGQGTAVAVVRNRLEPSGTGTRVVAETDLQITGPQAQFGKGVLEDVGGRVLEEFSRRLEEAIAASGTESGRNGMRTSTGAGSATSASLARESMGESRADGEVLDLGKMIAQSSTGTALKIAATALVASLFGFLLWRWRERT